MKKKLVASVVRRAVPPGVIGAYSLGSNASSIPHYIGRSDTDLRRRLLQHSAKGRYDWFIATPTMDTYAAFYLECRSWHALKRPLLTNRIHPAIPVGKATMCPFCDFSQVVDSCTYIWKKDKGEE